MPAVIVAIVTAIAYYGAVEVATLALTAAFGTFQGIGIAAAVIGAVVATAVGYGLSAAFGLNQAPKNSIKANAQERKQTIRSSIAPRQVVYGTARVSGPIVYASSSGDKKEYLHLVVPVAGHRVAECLALWINDQRIVTSDVDANGFVTVAPYYKTGSAGSKLGFTGDTTSIVRLRFFNGTQTTASSELIAETTDGWSADHILRDTAYFYLRLEFDRDVFGNGPGALSVEIKGHDYILDPRTNTYGWTDNPALCILHYLLSDYGLRCSVDEIDLASFITAANVCDENVTIAAGGTTQKRYRLNGAFTLDQKPIDVIDDMLTSCAGTLVYVAGQYRLHAGAYAAPTDTLTTADLAGPIELVTKPPRRELFNTVKGTFISPTRNWQATEFPQYSEAAIVTADGETITKDVEWNFTTDEIMAQRLAKLTLRRAREALTVRAPVKYSGIRFSVWQTLNVTLADFGWTNKPFRIVSWTFEPSSGIVNLTLREESSTSYSWTYGDAATLPLAPDTDLLDPLAIPAPTSIVVTATTSIQADGTASPALLVTWTAAAFAFLIGHEVQWRVTGSSSWESTEVPVGTNRFVIAPVFIGTSYDVRVRGVTGIARGAWSGTVTGTGAADTTAPDAPTSFAATGITRAVSLSWTMPTATDLAAVEVYENTSSSTTGRYFVGETRASGFVRTGLNPNVTRWFWARSRDASGNLSAYVGPVSATTSLLVADDIQDGILGTAKFASTLQPVEYGDALPSTGNFEGRLFYLRTNNTLYKYISGAWASTEGGQPIGFPQVVAGTIRAAAITSTEIAAGEVKAVNLASETLITQAAQLGSAVVQTAKIDNLAVTTLKVAGNAVSGFTSSTSLTTHTSNRPASSVNYVALGEVQIAIEGDGKVMLQVALNKVTATSAEYSGDGGN